MQGLVLKNYGVQFCRELPPGYGGIERIAFEINQILKTNKQKSFIICFPKVGSLRKKNYIFDNDVKAILSFGFLLRLRIPLDIRRLFNLFALVYNSRFLVAHQPDLTGLILISFFRLIFVQKQFVLFWHADPTLKNNKTLNLEFLRRIYNFCFDEIVTTSSKLLQESYYLSYLSKKKPSSVVPCCISEELENKYMQLHKSPSTRFSQKSIVFIGRDNTYKRLDFFLKVISQSKLLLNAKIISPNLSKERVKQISNITNLNISIHTNLNDSEKAFELSTSTLLYLPSISPAEAFGIVQLEAMNFGIPLISHGILNSGVSEVNQHNITGSVLPVNANSQYVASQIDEIISDFDRYASLSSNSRERYQKKYRRQVFAYNIQNLLLK